MKPQVEQSDSIIGFMLWLLWVSIATLVLGGTIYLFVGGSTFFSGQNTEAIVIYREVNDDLVSLTGSILLPSACHGLELDNSGTGFEQQLTFSFYNIEDCASAHDSRVPETFFVQFNGGKDTELSATVNGIKRELIIK